MVKKINNIQQQNSHFKKIITSSDTLLIGLILICIISIILSIILYFYLTKSASQIEDISIEYVKSNSISTITYLKEVVQNKIRIVSSNLFILSNLPLIKQHNASATSNLVVAQSTTNDLTEGYGWIDEKGKLLWSTTFLENKTTQKQFANFNASNRPYFLTVKETYKPFVSNAFTTENYNPIPRIVISYPILSLKTNITTSTVGSTAVAAAEVLLPLPLQPKSSSSTTIQNENNNKSLLALYDKNPITAITNNQTLVDFQQLYNHDTNFLKHNFDFKGIITASINSVTLEKYFNSDLFNNLTGIGNNDKNIFDYKDNNKSAYNNDNGINLDALKDGSPSLNESQHIQYTNIKGSSIPIFSFPGNAKFKNTTNDPAAFYLTPKSSHDTTLSHSSSLFSTFLKPNVLLTDNSGMILYSSDKRIKTGSNYLSPENTQIIKVGYDLKTADFIISVLDNLSNNKGKSYSGTLELVNKRGNKSIINFEPVMLNGKHIFYLSTNTNFAPSDNAKNLMTNQIMFTFLFIGALLFVIFSFIAIVLLINKRLKNEVNNKTKQLQDNLLSLKEANDKLIQSEELEREFINTAAHELRTPTQAITGYSEIDDELFNDLIKNRQYMTDKELETTINILSKNHNVISRNVTRLDNLINNLLYVAKIESHNDDQILLSNMQKMDLIEEIRDVFEQQLNQKIKDKNIKIKFKTLQSKENPFCWVSADKSRLNQILNNLLDNAIKFSKKGSIIDIQVYQDFDDLIKEHQIPGLEIAEDKKINIDNTEKKESREIYISITDFGKGISSKIMPRLFEKFNTDSDGGTGLGLYITRKLVEAHGGKIWAFNNKDGVGATFVFSLPTFDIPSKEISNN